MSSVSEKYNADIKELQKQDNNVKILNGISLIASTALAGVVGITTGIMQYTALGLSVLAAGFGLLNTSKSNGFENEIENIKVKRDLRNAYGLQGAEQRTTNRSWVDKVSESKNPSSLER